MTSAENTNVQQVVVADDSEDGITLMDLMRIIRKHLVTATIVFVMVFAGVTAYTFLVPPKYTATAQAMATYNASQGDDAGISQQYTGGTYIAGQITSYTTLATTETVLEPVIKDLGLDTSVKSLAEQLTVTNPTNTAFVNISAEDGDAQQASDIANAVAVSMQNVIQNDLYSAADKSPVKISIVQRARVPESPSSPNKPLYLAVGVVAGLVLGVFAALLKDMLNTKVEETSDVRSLVGASSLGSVPQDNSLGEKRPVLVSQPNGPIAEEFRRIHTNIEFLQTDKVAGKGQLLVITSAQPSEGKTTTSINVAAPWLKMVLACCWSTPICAILPLHIIWVLKVRPVWRTCFLARCLRKMWCRTIGSRLCIFFLLVSVRRMLACFLDQTPCALWSSRL